MKENQVTSPKPKEIKEAEFRSSLEMETKKITLYNEFYNDHKELFGKDRQQFMFEQMRYVESKFREWIYAKK